LGRHTRDTDKREREREGKDVTDKREREGGKRREA
jgi:hypothetical protein